MKHGMLKLLAMAVIACQSPYVLAGINGDNQKVMWTYEGNHGPTHWSELAKQYQTCHDGKRQSPIDIKASRIKRESGDFKAHYEPISLRLINTPHTLKLLFSAEKHNEYVVYKGEKYELVNIHIHNPSENLIDGESFPLEIHCVHQSAQNHYLVMSIFAKAGRQNSFLHDAFHYLPQERDHESNLKNVMINPTDLLPKSHNYFAYEGSFTTPPCTEGVHWIVMEEPIQASLKQIQFFKQHVTHDNRRPVQPLNGRRIFLNLSWQAIIENLKEFVLGQYEAKSSRSKAA